VNSRQFAQIFGAIYLIVGILGFIPGVTQATTASYGAGGGALLGLFPINYLHDVVHLVLGAWGLASAGSMARAVSFCRAFAVILIVLGIYGFFSTGTDGLVPLSGYDTYLHLASGLLAAYFGWGAPAKAVA
jgi:hypothetical protein